MATVKFDKQDELNELLARITLDIGITLSKKELIEIIFELGSVEYEALLSLIEQKKRQPEDNINLRQEFITKYSGCIELPDEEEINPKKIWERTPEDH